MKILVTYEFADILALIKRDLASKGMSLDSVTSRPEFDSNGESTGVAIDVRMQDVKEIAFPSVELPSAKAPVPSARDLFGEAPEPGRGPIRVIGEESDRGLGPEDDQSESLDLGQISAMSNQIVRSTPGIFPTPKTGDR